MHPRNKHAGDYDFKEMVKHKPTLDHFVKTNPTGKFTIDFSDPSAVKALNAAILAKDYNINTWDIPAGYLCPPIPGRADYIHHLADLLVQDSFEEIPQGKSITGLDIGTGANLIYPIIGSQSYGWRFIGSDIDKIAIQSANMIIKMNKRLEKLVSVRRQKSTDCIFHGIIQPQDKFTFTLCNPPFHVSAKAAAEGSQRKNKNLSRNKDKRSGGLSKNSPMSPKNLNFSGKSNELWCPGGELSFIKRMIRESENYKTQVQWFTTLVSKKDNLKNIQQSLKQINASDVRVQPMEQGSKISRFIAWRF